MQMTRSVRAEDRKGVLWAGAAEARSEIKWREGTVESEVAGGGLHQTHLRGGCKIKRSLGRDIQAGKDDLAAQPIFEEMNEGFDFLIAEEVIQTVVCLWLKKAGLRADGGEFGLRIIAPAIHEAVEIHAFCGSDRVDDIFTLSVAEP